MAAANPLTPDEQNTIRRMHGEGATRNDIARALGRSASTITAFCRREHLAFDRAATQAATEAKVKDAKARRAEIALGLLDDAQRLREQLFAPAIVFSFGGKDNNFNQRNVPEPPARDKRDLMGSISLALTASMRLDEHDRGSDVDEAKSMLDDLFAGLSEAWNRHHQEGGDAEPAEPGTEDEP